MAFALAVHVGLAMALSASLNLWQDEAFTLYTTDSGPLVALERAVNFEFQPPLYFVAVDLWRYAGGSVFWARMFSTACTAAAVLVTVLAARRLAPRVAAGAAAAVAATNPAILWAASEIRCYGLAILLSALLIWLFDAGYRDDAPGRGRYRWGFLASAVAALYTQYYLGFLLVAFAAALAVERRWRPLAHYLAGMALVGAAFTPLAALVAWQVREHAPVDARDDVRSLVGGWRQVYWRLAEYWLPLDSHSPWYGRLVGARDWLVRLAVVAAAVAAALSARRRGVVACAVVLAVAGTFFALLRIGLGPDFFVPRYTVGLIVPAIVLLLAAVSLLANRLVIASVVAVVLAANLSTAYGEFVPPIKMGDWARVAGWVSAREQPGEPIVLFINECELPFAHYYRGPNRLVPLAAPFEAEGYSPSDAALGGLAEVQEVVRGAVAPGGRFWLVICQEQIFQGIDKHPEHLTAFLDAEVEVLEETPFRGTRVLECRLRSPQ